MAEKRAYRSGSLYQRKSDGRWIGSLPDGHGGTLGYVTGTEREDVERRLAKLASSSTSRRKPPSFVWWILDCLGVKPEDTFDDLFHGSGAVRAAHQRWRDQTALPFEQSDLGMAAS